MLGCEHTFAFIQTQSEALVMSALFLLLFISICIALVFLVAFLWSVKKGQYDDDYTPSVRMLFDDTKQEPPIENQSNTTLSKH